MDEHDYQQILEAARAQLEKDGDEKSFISTGFYVGLHKLSDGYNNPEMKEVLAANQHLIKGATQTVISRLFDARPATNESALEELLRRSSTEFFRDPKPLVTYIASLFGIKW